MIDKWVDEGVARAERSRLIGRVRVSVLNRSEALRRVVDAIGRREPTLFGFCNAHTVNMARKSECFAAALDDHTIFADGIGVDIASKILYGATFPDNLNGTDFTPAVLRSCTTPLSVFLLGSAPGIAELAAVRIEHDFFGVSVVGTHHGFFSDADSINIVRRIRSLAPDLVLLGMGHPRQEVWAAAHGKTTGAVLMAVGAYLDFAAGFLPRAPTVVRRMRMEWIYRLLLEPRRMASRYLIGNVTFLSAIIRQKLNRKGQGGGKSREVSG